MKLLNALEGFKPDGSAGDTAVLREGYSVLLRALYPACPHITHGLWTSWATPPRWATCWTPLAAGGRGRAGAGRDRAGAADQRQAARRGEGAGLGRQGAIEAAAVAALADPELQKFTEGKPPKKVVVVPGRLVNVVV
jgi:leucyl-tRNA synthetase